MGGGTAELYSCDGMQIERFPLAKILTYFWHSRPCSWAQQKKKKKNPDPITRNVISGDVFPLTMYREC